MHVRIFFGFTILFSLSVQAQNEIRPSDGIDFINNAFGQFDVVALGESHALEEQYVFLERLLRDVTFQNTVDDIVIEFGNSLYQPILDKYVKGGEVEISELEKVWINTSQSPVDPWSSILYRNFIDQVRMVNIKEQKFIRILAGDPAINWDDINTTSEFRKYLSRDSVMAAITCQEVLEKNRQALIITGGAHLSKIHRPNPISNALPVNLEIEMRFPGSVILIQTITGFGKYTEEYEPKLLNVPLESIFNIKDTWIGKVPLPSVIGPVPTSTSTNTANASDSAPISLVREDIYDAFLYLGPMKNLHWINALPSVYKDDLFWEELNRRSKIRFNNELIPESRLEGSPRPKAYR